MSGYNTTLELLIAAAPEVGFYSRPEALAIHRGSLWVSRSTRRRCVVLWASETKVCLSYDETHNNARKVHDLQDFVRLYMEV